MKLLEAERALVKIPAFTMDGRTKKRKSAGGDLAREAPGPYSLLPHAPWR